MKKLLTPAITFLMVITLFVSCSKNGPDYIPKPVPGTGSGQTAIRLAFNYLPLPSNGTGYSALVTIEKENGQVVYENKKFAIEPGSVPVSAKIHLATGRYKLKSLMIVNSSNVAEFASPMASSIKAVMVTNPLAITFEQKQSDTAKVQVEVLGIESADNEQAFGYPANAFNRSQTPDPTAHSFIIKVRSEIKVGNVLYDSIPSSLMIRSWDSAQQISVSFHSLKGGINEFTLSKSKVKYELTLEKWGLSEKFIIPAAEFENGKLYKFSGTKSIKPLRSEVTSILVNGVYKADSKNTYLYNADGSLSEIQYQRKKADGTPYLDVTDRFEYSGNKLQNITRFKPDADNGEIVQFIEFYYDNQGRVNRMREVNEAGETNATVEYYTIDGREETTLHYSYPGKTFTMNYYKIYEKGNLVKGNSLTSHHNSEISMYGYDNQINPYHQMGWPDIFLSRSSKNNVTYEQTTYQGAYPIHVPYSFNYTYESDGYPKELVKQYRTYLTGQHAYTAKTTFYY